MSTLDLYKYVKGEVFAASKIAQPIPGTGIVNIVAPDGVTPIGYKSIKLYDDAIGTTELVLDTDFTIQEKDIEYSAEEGYDVYRSVQIINAAYQSAVFYADYDCVGGYSVRETFLDADNEYTGANTFTGATPQVASAWVNFNGTGVVAIRDDYNVDSITDGGTGIYTVNIDTDLDNVNYAISTSAGGASGYSIANGYSASAAKTVGACKIFTYSTNTSSATDDSDISVIIFGGKA